MRVCSSIHIIFNKKNHKIQEKHNISYTKTKIKWRKSKVNRRYVIKVQITFFPATIYIVLRKTNFKTSCDDDSVLSNYQTKKNTFGDQYMYDQRKLKSDTEIIAF